MRYAALIHFFLILSFVSSCGGGNHLDIKGNDEAIALAESMIFEMGGKKNWRKLKSMYIRTISRNLLTGETYAIEEWINLDEPKFMNHRIKNDIHYFQIVHKNDGWSVQNSNVSMMVPANVTGYLDWYDNFFMKNVKLLALGGEKIEVKLNGDKTFDVFINNKFNSRFQLDESNLPARYFVPGKQNQLNMINVEKWGEYKGFKYPLLVTGEGKQAHYQTDYWDAGFLDAESSFNISFDPHKIAESF